MIAIRKFIMDFEFDCNGATQQRAVCIERCKHGSVRGLRRPAAEMR